MPNNSLPPIAGCEADIRKAEQRAYASSTVYAQRLLKESIPSVADEIDRLRTTRLLRGKAGKALAPLAQYTMSIPSKEIALITLKTLFDVTTDPKDRADLANNVIDRIGIAIEQEAKWRYFNSEEPNLLRLISHQQHSGKGLHYSDYHCEKSFKEAGIIWDNWPRLSRVKVGACFCEAACSTGWWERKLKQVANRRTAHICPTPVLLELISGLIDKAELFAPLTWSMIVEPNEWSNEKPGGYLTNELRKGHKLIRTFGVVCQQGPLPLAYINRLQRTAYRINPFILEVSQRLEDDGYKIESAKFIPEDRRPLPIKPVDIETNDEARLAHRKLAAETHDYNSTALKRCIQTKISMSLARRFAKEDRYWLPWSFDYRSRVYPIPSFLTPMDTCFGKSLLQFADGERLTERGLY